MTICPNCNQEINHLEAYKTRGSILTLTIPNGPPVYHRAHELDSWSFGCPRCGEDLTNNEEKALEILSR